MTYHFPIKEGDRVALAPHLDLWMQGERFGTVIERNENEEGQTLWLIRTDNARSVYLPNEDLLGAIRSTKIKNDMALPMELSRGGVLVSIEDNMDGGVIKIPEGQGIAVGDALIEDARRIQEEADRWDAGR